MSLLTDNLVVLNAHHPALARRLAAYPDRNNVVVLKAKDGGVAYGVRRGGNVQAVSDPVAPLQRIQTQLDQHSKTLQDFTRPVMVVGLYPGNELLYLFDLSEQVSTPHCPQPIRVCVDSLACLQGFLTSWNACRVLESARVHWFWHEDVDRELAWLREHPEFPHVATLISGAPEAVLNRVMPGFAALVIERDEEQKRLRAENEAYYDAMSDEDLARIIGNAECLSAAPPPLHPPPSTSNLPPSALRKPRLLMPTCSWSTFVQYSTRDLCAAFELRGWETRILRMDAMLTPWRLVKAINEFKPDLFLFIDHMRYEAEEVYPKNLMFITWVQDDMANIQNPEAGARLTEYARCRKRDLVIGYTDELLARNGYPKERLISLNIPANPAIFRPIPLTGEQRGKYGCELAFVTNASMDTRRIVEETIWPQTSAIGFTADGAMRIHDDLWTLYRAGQTLVARDGCLKWLAGHEEFRLAYAALPGGATEFQRLEIVFDDSKSSAGTASSKMIADDLFRLFYWRLNDAIYRQVVLEWADELGVDLKLYGLGWETHPRFGKYAAGPVAHGPELNVVYQAAKHHLDLNITQGMHQRLWEILSANGAPLVRIPSDLPEPPVKQRLMMNKLALQTNAGASLVECLDQALGSAKSDEWSPAEREDLATFLFEMALNLTRHASTKSQNASPAERDIEAELLKIIEAKLRGTPAYVLKDWDRIGFHDKSELAARLKQGQ